jgi:hypothetical protein
MVENFKKDLVFGEKYELILLEHIGEYESYIKPQGCFKEYDLKVYKKKKEDEKRRFTTYEVKADRFGYKTNNIAIEFMSNNKPSGITSTTAKKWAIFLIDDKGGYDLYIIPTIIIKNMIDNIEYKKKMKVANFKNDVYLFDKDKFIDYKKIF